jgi:hypothetical protein
MITNTVIYTFLVGVVSGLVIAGARVWARDMGLKMTWCKWLLSAFWYILLNFFVFLDFTMIGEGETGAGLKLLFFQGVTMFILGVGLVRVLWAGRTKKSP